jgi:hypothetical protein
MQFLCPDAFQNALFAQNEPAEQVPTNARHSKASSIADSVEYIFVLAPAGNTHNGMPSILLSCLMYMLHDSSKQTAEDFGIKYSITKKMN